MTKTICLRLLNAVSVLLVFTAAFYVLTNGIPLVQAGFVQDYQRRASIRTTLIAVLLFFLFGTKFFPNTFKGLWISRAAEAIERIPAFWLFTVCFGLFSFSQLSIQLVAHSVLQTRGYDLGIFAQAVWNTLHGDFLFSSLKGNICLMGDHMSPIILAAVPFYALWPDPRTLMFLQTAAVAACIYPIGYLAKKKTGSVLIAFIFVLAYLFYNPTRSILREDFHPETLAEPFHYLAFFFLQRGKMKSFLATIAIIAMGKENMWGIVFMFGLYAFAVKRWKFGILVSVIAVIGFYIVTQKLVPYLSGAYSYSSYYAVAASSNMGAAIAAKLFGQDALTYLFKILAPFLFLSFFHLPTFFLALPILLQNLLSNVPTMRSLSYHYSLGLTPFIIISSLYGWEAVSKKWVWFSRSKVLIGFLLLFSSLLQSAPSDYHHFMERYRYVSKRNDKIIQSLRSVPKEVPVSTHNTFIAQIPNRKKIYPLSFGSDIPDDRELYIILDPQLWEKHFPPFAEAVLDLEKKGFVKIDNEAGIFIFRRT